MRVQHREHRERGAAAVEFALVAPLLLYLVFGIIAYGVWFADGVSIRDAARSAARSASIGQPIDVSRCPPAGGGQWSATQWPAGAEYAKRVACTAAAGFKPMGSHAYYKVAFSSADPGRGDLVYICIATRQGLRVPFLPLPNGGISRITMVMPIEEDGAILLDANGGATLIGGHDADPGGSGWPGCGP